MTTTIRVLIADDDPTVRRSLKSAFLLSREASFIIVEAGSAAETIPQARNHQVDVILLDVFWPEGQIGIDKVLPEIRGQLGEYNNGGPAVVVITGHRQPGDAALIAHAGGWGIEGFFDKREIGEDYRRMVRWIINLVNPGRAGLRRKDDEHGW